MPKAPASTLVKRHNPLEVELKESEGRLKRQYPNKKSKKAASNDVDEDAGQTTFDSKTSKKIMRLAREQDAELEQEEASGRPSSLNKQQQQEIELDDDESDDESEYSDSEDEEEYIEYEAGQQMSAEDEALYNKFLGKNFEEDADEEFDEESPILADRIMAKIQEQQARLAAGEELVEQPQAPAANEEVGVLLPEKVIMVYSQIGLILSRYRSGKLPKAFKIIPTLRNWEEVLYVTNPPNWSPHAVYEATKIFVSSTDAVKCQKFIYVVLLERFREEMKTVTETGEVVSSSLGKKNPLNYHIYRALKKALYKPAAFIKGFLAPLAESGTCTAREATVVASILSKVSIPVLHAGGALMRLTEEAEYSPACSLFIKVLLNKKYSLPYKVIDDVFFYFNRYKSNPKFVGPRAKKLPIMWHQSLLVFAQRYKNDMTEDQISILLDLIRVHSHAEITPEIRRELLSGKPREEQNAEMEID